jgi:hypothetical protein
MILVVIGFPVSSSTTLSSFYLVVFFRMLSSSSLGILVRPYTPTTTDASRTDTRFMMVVRQVRFVGIATSITSISKTKGGGAGAGGVLSHDSGCGCCRCLYRARFLNSLLVGRGRFAS